ncbi:sigma-70 family RNA polymerase sigma factor [bacterium]|nr:sigma-70 family RNA polymerase sigma factor [candidate division CSSED10-310 bacterium]
MSDSISVTDLSDEALMLQVKDGNHDAFGELLRRYERQLTVFFLRQLGDEDGARDLVMDTFLRIYKAAYRYEPRAKFSTYIYQVARNLIINEAQKREIRKADSLDQMNENSSLQLAMDDPDPEQVLARKEQQLLVQKALEDLPEDQRTILILLEYQELSYERVAQIMGCSMGTVKSRMHRARQKVREWMEQHEL